MLLFSSDVIYEKIKLIIRMRGESRMMTGEQIKKLARMKKLINLGYKRFAHRQNRDYIQELLDIGNRRKCTA